MRYWEGKTVQLSNVALLSFSNILSPELAIILELMSGFCALELGICFKSLTGKTWREQSQVKHKMQFL